MLVFPWFQRASGVSSKTIDKRGVDPKGEFAGPWRQPLRHNQPRYSFWPQVLAGAGSAVTDFDLERVF
jgi:hypothetical protein